MDGSRKVARVFKKGRHTGYAQRHFVRCTDIESAMEYEDSFEPVSRYISPVETAEPKPRKRTQLRSMGKQARLPED